MLVLPVERVATSECLMFALLACESYSRPVNGHVMPSLHSAYLSRHAIGLQNPFLSLRPAVYASRTEDCAALYGQDSKSDIAKCWR